MRNILIVTFLLTVLNPFPATAQQITNNEIGYKGGIDSLHKDLYTNLFASGMNISANHFVFIELTLDKEPGIKNIGMLNQSEDSTAKKVVYAIQDNSKKWFNDTKEIYKIIIPVFLIKDAEASSRDANAFYTLTSQDYKKRSDFIKCYFVSPIVINFYHQEN